VRRVRRWKGILWIGIERCSLHHNHLIHLSKTASIIPRIPPQDKKNPKKAMP